MSQDHYQYMRIAIEEAGKAAAEGNSAVGSVIVAGDLVVVRGRNLVFTTNDPTAHAETVAIREAGKVLREVDLTGATLYTTFEPCPMCCGAIMVCGISTLVMGSRHNSSDDKWADYTVESLIALAGWQDSLKVVTDILQTECDKVWGDNRT